MAACARSTGAMLPRCRWESAGGSSALSAVELAWGHERGAEGVGRVAAGGGGGIGGARAADQDDAGGEGVGVGPAHSVSQFRSHRPGSTSGESGANNRVEKGLPPSAGRAFDSVALGLLECVVDGDRKRGVHLLGQAVHRPRHAIKEERFRLLLAAIEGRDHGLRSVPLVFRFSTGAASRRSRAPVIGEAAFQGFAHPVISSMHSTVVPSGGLANAPREQFEFALTPAVRVVAGVTREWPREKRPAAAEG